MNYQGGRMSEHLMADRMRQAERARVARDVARRKGPGPAKRVATMVIALLTLKH